MARSPFPRLFLLITLLPFILLFIPNDASGALTEHCCDLTALPNPPNKWWPTDYTGPRCVDVSLECILDPAVDPFCGIGAGSYQARSFWPSPPDLIQQETITPYWCIIPLNHSSMDLGASGPVTPCDNRDDCVDDGNCYNTADTSWNADGDGDTDFCDGGTWKDCADDGQCPACNTCFGNNCVPQTETTDIQCNDDIDNDCDGDIDEKDSDCCTWCEGSYQWDSTGLGGCSEASDFSWESEATQETWCCGDDVATEFYKTDYGFEACCNADGDCVDSEGVCRDGTENTFLLCNDGIDNDCDDLADGLDPQCAGLCGTTENNTFWPGEADCNQCDHIGDEDGNTFFDQDDPTCCAECEAGEGWEFDDNGLGTCVGSSDFGWENPLEPKLQNQSCCGDDVGYEFFITRGVGPDMCCNATTDCVDFGGNCQVNDVWSPGGCTDGIDNNCNGQDKVDGSEPGCLATLSGTVTDDEIPPNLIGNATVTAVGWDPITGVSVNFTNVTGVSGKYEMDVIVNLTYEIVVKVPGYGTGFEWNQSVGNGGRSINFRIKKAENCEPDCTGPGENLCRPECWGVNNCEYDSPSTFGVCAEGAQKDWILPIPGTNFEVQCCEGAPVQRKRTQVVGVSGAKSVVRVTRIISYAGQLITLVIDVFK